MYNKYINRILWHFWKTKSIDFLKVKRKGTKEQRNRNLGPNDLNGFPLSSIQISKMNLKGKNPTKNLNFLDFKKQQKSKKKKNFQPQSNNLPSSPKFYPIQPQSPLKKRAQQRDFDKNGNGDQSVMREDMRSRPQRTSHQPLKNNNNRKVDLTEGLGKKRRTGRSKTKFYGPPSGVRKHGFRSDTKT